MNAVRQGMRERMSSPDWTLVSAAMYFTLPFIWRIAIPAHLSLSSSYFLEFLISILVWGTGLLAFLRSGSAWQRALCLQLGLMLAPTSAEVISHFFWDGVRDWGASMAFSSWAVTTIFLAFGLPWLGLMYAPALFSLRNRPPPPLQLPDSTERLRRFVWSRAAVWISLLAWTAAACTGLAGSLILPVQSTSGNLLLILLMGALQGLVLRHFGYDGWMWMLMTTAGFICAFFLAGRFVALDLYLGSGLDFVELDPLFVFSTLGAVVGLFQWSVLRRRLEHAYWWIPANILGWTAGWALAPEDAIGMAVMGMVVGIVTGTMLLRLLHMDGRIA